MRAIFAFVLVGVVWEVRGYPSGYYPYYGGTVDSLAYGASDRSHGAMLMNRYYQPHYPRGLGGMAAFMFQPPPQQPSQGYYQPDKRQEPSYTPPQTPQQIPQQNEVYYPQAPEDSYTTKIAEADPTTEKAELSTTLRAIPEIIEPEVEEVEEVPRKRVSKKKQDKRPVEDEEEEDLSPKMPGGMFFPMYFGWGRRAQGGGGGGGPGGVMAIANAYSNGRGGVSSSHATAYGAPREDPVKL